MYRVWLSGLLLSTLIWTGCRPATVVVRPDGRPAAGADVYSVCGTSGAAELRLLDGRVDISRRGVRVDADLRTHPADNQGRFRLPDCGEPSLLAAWTDEGMVVRWLKPEEVPGRLALLPYGRIEGTLHHNGAIAAGRPVHATAELGRKRSPSLRLTWTTLTDDRGNFQLSRVWPHDAYRVAMGVGGGRTGTAPTCRMTTSVGTGATAHVALDCVGLVVRGHVRLPEHPYISSRGSFWNVRLESQRPAGGDVHGRAGVSATAGNGDGGGDAMGRVYLAAVDADGAFRFDDVALGRYELSGGLTSSAGTLAQLRPMSVVASPGRNNAAELALGDITAVVSGIDRVHAHNARVARRDRSRLRSLRPSGPAQSFDLTSVDGKRVRLSDFSGRYLLMHCWSAADPPQDNHLGVLAECLLRFQGQLELLGLNTDADIDLVRGYRARHQMTWPQVMLTRRQQELFQYSYTRVPRGVYLISPTGAFIRWARTDEAVLEMVEGEMWKLENRPK